MHLFKDRNWALAVFALTRSVKEEDSILSQFYRSFYLQVIEKEMIEEDIRRNVR